MDNIIDELVAVTKMPPPLCWEGYKDLAQDSSPESLRVLLTLADSKDWAHKRAAVEAIGGHRHGLVAEDFLINLLTQNNVYIIKASINALAKLTSTKAHDKIRMFVKATDQSVRETAIRALGNIWQDEDFDFLMGLYQHDNDSTKKEIGLVLWEKITTDNWHTFYLLFKQDKIVRHRHWALFAAGKFGDNDITLIEHFLHDKDGHIRKEAAHLLNENGKK